MNKKNLLCLAALFSFSIFAQDTPVFNNPKDKIIVSQAHPEFTITLQSNPTTGYSWKLNAYDKGLVTFVKHQYVAPTNKKLMGAPGYEQWTFTANKAHYRVNQVGHVRFEYRRPWEKAAVKKVNFIVVVKK